MNTGIQWEVGKSPVYSFILVPRCRAHLRHRWLARDKNEQLISQLITDTTHSFSFAFFEPFFEQSAWNGVPKARLIINDAQLLKVYYGLLHFLHTCIFLYTLRNIVYVILH